MSTCSNCGRPTLASAQHCVMMAAKRSCSLKTLSETDGRWPFSSASDSLAKWSRYDSALSSSHGIRRVASSHMIFPNEYTSTSGPYCSFPRYTSGAIHRGVPTALVMESGPCCCCCWTVTGTALCTLPARYLEVPKSATLACWAESIRTFSLLRSLCTICSEWRCCIPLATSRAMVSRVRHGTKTAESRRYPFSVPPAKNSVTMKFLPSCVVPAPRKTMRFGCLIVCNVSHSLWKSSTDSGSMSELLRILIATTWPPQRPSHTAPNVPSAIARTKVRCASAICHPARIRCTVTAAAALVVESSKICAWDSSTFCLSAQWLPPPGIPPRPQQSRHHWPLSAGPSRPPSHSPRGCRSDRTCTLQTR
eukprot:m.382497 g.382497  ORF g.382497 m.382497 type:complete len:364 (+) comp16721_c1_seq9:259-1350(+)